MARLSGLLSPTTSDTGRADTRAGTIDRPAAHERTDAGAARTETVKRPAVVRRTGLEPVVAPAKRTRASLLATLSLILGVVAALVVLTGVLAKLGIAIGIVAALLAVGGLSAARHPHVTGRFDALLGLVLALGAISAGALALAGSLPWLGVDVDQVARLQEWLGTLTS
jgi:hypothetical protein